MKLHSWIYILASILSSIVPVVLYIQFEISRLEPIFLESPIFEIIVPGMVLLDMYRSSIFDTHSMITGFSCTLITFIPLCLLSKNVFLVLAFLFLSGSIIGYIYSFFREIKDNKKPKEKIDRSSYFFIICVYSLIITIFWHAINRLDMP